MKLCERMHWTLKDLEELPEETYQLMLMMLSAEAEANDVKAQRLKA
jgi:hypothetical protein